MPENNSATKEDLAAVQQEMKQDLAAVEQVMKQDLAAVQQEMKQDLAAVEQEMKQDLAAVEQRLTHAIEQVLETSRNMETSLLTAFHSYAKGNSARLVKIEASDVSADLRLNAIEDRVLALETRRPH